MLVQHDASHSALKLMDYLYSVLVVSVSEVQEVCEVSFEEASDIVREFEQWGILEEIGSERYAFKRYVAMVSKGTLLGN